MLSKFLDVNAVKENALIAYGFLNEKLNEYLLSRIQSGQYSTKKVLAGTVVILIVGKTFFKWISMRRYFKKLGIQGPPPLPVFGNMLDVMSQGFDGFDTVTMQKFNGTCGVFEGTMPVILTTDPKFIKEVMIKDSANFINRRAIEGLMIDPADKFLTVLRDEEWKNVRSILTTSFTSGKLKEMTKLMKGSCQATSRYAGKLAQKSEEFNAKTLFGSFTLDVISSCLFGFEANSIENPDNEFIKHLQILFSNTLSPKLAILFLFPKLGKYLAEYGIVDFFSSTSLSFLKQVSEGIIERRRAKLETRTDFIQNMVEHEELVKNEARAEVTADSGSKWKAMKKTLTNKEIMAQAVLFLAAGYETTASNLTLVAYNLAMHPEYQEKLSDEIDEVLSNHKGEVNYDSIAEMKYMDMVINETLRLYPPTLRVDRVAAADYNYQGMKILKGTIWTACLYGMHHDPKNFPDPEEFKPERFSGDGAKTDAFLPFGSGPRACLGQRFALIETKVILAELLSKFKFVASEKTPKKIKLDMSGLARPTEPIFLKIEARNQ